MYERVENILKMAEESNTSAIAFICMDDTMARSVVCAAEATNTPAIIMLYPEHVTIQKTCNLSGFAAMVEEMGRVKTGQITYAVRNTVIDDMEIHEGDIMGIGDHGMLAVSTSLEKTTVDTLKAMLDEDSELVTVYYGSDVSAADAQALTAKLQESCPDVEIELQKGGQPIYYYLISVE